MSCPVVVKVGGSLFDLPDLGARLRTWLGTLDAAAVLLVPGGGPGVNVVRDLDRIHRLGQVVSHWLALRVLTANAEFIAALVDAPIVLQPGTNAGLAVLDSYAFCRADEARLGHLPHTWDVTSDSIAARAAVVARAGRLVLLKSCDAGPNTCDGMLRDVLAGTDIRVETINLRRLRLSEPTT